MGTTTIDTDELDRMKRRLAVYEGKDAEREQRHKNLKTPEQLTTIGKPFPMPGQVWQFEGPNTNGIGRVEVRALIRFT